MARVVDAPAQRPTRAGSLRTTGTERDGSRLLDGIAFRPESCASGGLVELCEGGTKTITAPDGPVCVNTVGLWTGDECSLMTGVDTIIDTIDRVERRLDITTSHKLEQYLWTGEPYDIHGSDDSCLDATLASPSASDLGGPFDLVPAVAAVIEALDDSLQGGRGVLHVPRHTLPYLTFYGLVTRFNDILQIANTDHLVVAGAGYPGTDPDGNDPSDGFTWFYATGIVEYALSEIMVPGRDDPASLVDRSVNTVEVRAERGGAAWFDPCAHYAVEVCLANPGPGCDES